MFKNKFLVAKIVMSLFFVSNVFAEDNEGLISLDKLLVSVIKTEPDIQEMYHRYKKTTRELKMSEAGYYPKVDFEARAGLINSKKYLNPTDETDYGSTKVALKIVQNIFDGYGTQSAVEKDDARVKATYYKYLEVVQDRMFRVSKAYIHTLRNYEVFKVAKSNVETHENILNKIEEKYKQGFGSISELQKAQSKLSLAIANYVSAKNNYMSEKITLEKLAGKPIFINEMSKPQFHYNLPKTLADARRIGLENNPSIIVSDYDIEFAKKAIKNAKKAYYPTLNLELEAAKYNNESELSDPRENEFKATLIFKYNLYNGDYNKQEVLKYKDQVKYEKLIKERLKNEVQESVDLAWSEHSMAEEQYQFQEEYENYTILTLDTYKDEFKYGKRSLLELLDIYDEINNIKIKSINIDYDILFYKFRILDAIGMLHMNFKDDFLKLSNNN